VKVESLIEIRELVVSGCDHVLQCYYQVMFGLERFLLSRYFAVILVKMYQKSCLCSFSVK